MAKTSDIEKLKPKAPENCPNASQWASAMRRRLSEKGMDVEEVALAMALKHMPNRADQPTDLWSVSESAQDKIDRVTRWLVGIEMPDEPEHETLLEIIDLPDQYKEHSRALRKLAADELKALPEAPEFKRNSRMARETRQGQQTDKTVRPCQKTRESDEFRDRLEQLTHEEVKELLEQGDKEGLNVYQFLTALQHYVSAEQGEVIGRRKLSTAMGFKPGVFEGWVNNKAESRLPESEAFEQLKSWIAEEISLEAAQAFEAIYFTQAVERYQGTNFFAELPPEFWRAVAETTNEPEKYQGQGGWKEHCVQPCETVGAYLRAVRQAQGLTAGAFIESLEIASSDHTLGHLENDNAGSPDFVKAVVEQLIRNDQALKEQHEEGYKPLFSIDVCAGLVQPTFKSKPIDLQASLDSIEGAQYHGRMLDKSPARPIG